MNRFLAHRVAAALLSAIALAVVTHWMVIQPPPAAHARNALPLFVDMMQVVSERHPIGGPLGYWAYAILNAASAALGIFLALKARAGAPAAYLALALSAGAASTGFFMFLEPFEIAGVWRGPATDPGILFVLEALAYVTWFIAMLHVALLFRVFPQPIAPDDWKRHVGALVERAWQTYEQGWRARLYPRVLRARNGEGSTLAFLFGPPQTHSTVAQRGYSLELWRRPSFITAGIGLAIGVAGLEYLLRVHLPAGKPMPVMVSLMFMALSGVFAGVSAHEFLKFHRRRGSDEDRRRIEWIHATLFVGAIFFDIALFGSMLLFVMLVILKVSMPPDLPGQLMTLVPYLGFPLFLLACVAALALSIFYRGMIDPRLAAQRITVWGFLSIVVTIAFVLVERAIAYKVTQWLALPAESGPILAGAIVAATIAPIRGWVEKATNELVARFLPVGLVAGGVKREAAIALTDLSGYTALSGRDERKALLLAALLQQRAARVASAHGGRVVKSMGDAVLFEFHDAAEAHAALCELHEQFPEAAAAIGVDPLPLHSALNVGEVTVGRDGDVYGQTVNIAARLLGLAREGQIVLTEPVAARIDREGLEALGAKDLKNVQAPVTCFASKPALAT